MIKENDSVSSANITNLIVVAFSAHLFAEKSKYFAGYRGPFLECMIRYSSCCSGQCIYCIAKVGKLKRNIGEQHALTRWLVGTSNTVDSWKDFF